MVVRALDHVDSICNDLEASVAFYEALGFKILQRTKNHGGANRPPIETVELYLPAQPWCVLELHEARFFEIVGLNHVAFVCDDVEARAAALSERGFSMDNVRLNPDNQRWLASFRDRDGRRLQLASPRHDAVPTDTSSSGPVERLVQVELRTHHATAIAEQYAILGLAPDGDALHPEQREPSLIVTAPSPGQRCGFGALVFAAEDIDAVAARLDAPHERVDGALHTWDPDGNAVRIGG